MAFVSSRLSSTFIFGPQSFLFFFLHLPSTTKRAFRRSTLLKASRFIVHGRVNVYGSTFLPVFAGRLFVFRSTATPKINFDSAFVYLVDWQRCTQAVIRVHERMREAEKKKESEKKMSFGKKMR